MDINKMAETEYPIKSANKFLTASQSAQLQKDAFINGATKMQEHCIGFAEWCSLSDWHFDEHMSLWAKSMHKRITTSELFKIYSDEKEAK